MRLFIAIELPDEIKQGIALLQQAESQRERGYRWLPPDQLHLTLKFLGEVDPAQVEQVHRALESISRTGPCTLSFGEFRKLPDPRRPRVLALTITGDTDRLGAIHRELETALESRSFPRERRRFFPHVTLARR